ncbi:CheR family methyltransferase [Sporolituus thermophilus]|uniref:protein-glutamate O-methyltransferase n=1 Tax=Sporolituus thermophilus DSM 23256 TaxID=1123285 RepID=A0A1G7JU08_9FIRM|nr:protein-glutamate O-methyltransferase CheR [Sporolituus thermophilus]SDF28345.1 chemotaxis protein methyltransferase CheR [Sporolituus thermophilus DSM 23256]
MLSDREFKQFAKLIYERTGIWFEDNKRAFLLRRIRERMNSLGMADIDEYYQQLYFINNEKEWQELVNRLTINETYFFRDFPQLAVFAEEVLPQVVKVREASGQLNLRLWSAACSTGEEPYTLAIILKEMLPKPALWDIDILASDINTRVLDHALRGNYDDRSVRDVPPEYLNRYFIRSLQGYTVKPEIKTMVNFRSLNLLDSTAIREQGEFDFIFCRNVLIYFDDHSRQKVVEDLYRALRRGGYIFLGYSESVSRINAKFRAARVADHVVYYKP